MLVLKKTFQLLASLKLAVIVILALALSLAAATVMESLYDTPTAQYWIYRSKGFFVLLGVLGVNIFCVALSRYPWKPRHIPFLLAHAGILILLAGSWITERGGIDGSLRVSENETASVVDLDQNSLLVLEKDAVYSLPIPWTPPGVSFHPFSLEDRGFSKGRYDIQIDQYLTHADSTVSFVPNPDPAASAGTLTPSLGALHFKITGGPMQITQDLWLWEGESGWKSVQMGPAHFSLGSLQPSDLQPQPGQPSLAFRAEKGGGLSYVALSSSGKQVKGRFSKREIPGKKFLPGWKGDVAIELLEWIPQAMPSTNYRPARIQYGPQAPPSAIHLVASGAGVWLGLGDRASIHLPDREIGVAYFPKRIVLPFSLRLNRFTLEHDPGTVNPASYSSNVTVIGGANPKDAPQKDSIISMNEPLQMDGYTLYQASYEEGFPRPTVSIFSVNRDPGRIWKYLGSLLIVTGSILLFAAKYRRKQGASQRTQAPAFEIPMKPEFSTRVFNERFQKQSGGLTE